MGEFPSVELAHLIDPDRSISYGIVQPGSPCADGVPIIRVSDVRNGQISTTKPLRVLHDIEAHYSRTRLRGGELLITVVGTVGETAIVPQSLAGWNVARAIAVLPVRSDVGAYWVQLALQSPLVRSRIDSRLNTTVQATLNLGDVAKLPILLPPKPERERIEALVGALDRKIELNRRMNETLTSKGTIGRFARVAAQTPKFVYSPQVCFWRSTDPARIRAAILYLWMVSEDLINQINAVAGQTDMAPYVSLGDQRGMTMPVFGESQHAVADRVEPLLALQDANLAESRVLAAARDLLLPKLMSGEIRVKDAETIAEMVA